MVAAGVGLAAYTFSSVEGFWDWVRLVDEGGVDSIWQIDRTVSKEPFLECMSTMAALAGATKKTRFGMNVVSLGYRDPLIVAKECATIDYLSNGRLLPAFGLGSNRSRDWVGPGRTTKGRGKRMNEALEILTRLWAGEEVTYEGEYFQYDRVSISPLPVQKRIPLWIGGSSDAAIERTGKYGTGWVAASESPEEAGRAVDAINAAAKRYNRSIDDDHFGIGFAYRFGSWDDPGVERAARAYSAISKKDPKQGIAVGGVDEVMDIIEPYVANGLDKFILRPIGEGDEDMMEQTRLMIEQVQPAIWALNNKG
jgi:probable F420-dependent oxidoreductase